MAWGMRHWVTWLLLCVAQGGCGSSGCGPTDPDPCEQDRLGCGGDPTDFQHLDDCAVSDPLEVELGVGEASFAPLADGAAPAIHYGFQGGQHVFVAFRVKNAALAIYDQLKVTLWLGQGAGCALGPHAVGQLPAGCERDLALREVVIGGAESTLRVVDGVVEEFGLLLVIDYPTAATATVLAVEVEDPCGRTGAASHAWTTP